MKKPLSPLSHNLTIFLCLEDLDGAPRDDKAIALEADVDIILRNSVHVKYDY
jgi:hypothetical protein